MSDNEMSIDTDPFEEEDFINDESDDELPTECLDSEQTVEDYLMEALGYFTESEDASHWAHPDIRSCMLAEGNGLSLLTEVDGEEIEYRIVIHRV